MDLISIRKALSKIIFYWQKNLSQVSDQFVLGLWFHYRRRRKSNLNEAWWEEGGKNCNGIFFLFLVLEIGKSGLLFRVAGASFPSREMDLARNSAHILALVQIKTRNKMQIEKSIPNPDSLFSNMEGLKRQTLHMSWTIWLAWVNTKKKSSMYACSDTFFDRSIHRKVKVEKVKPGKRAATEIRPRDGGQKHASCTWEGGNRGLEKGK